MFARSRKFIQEVRNEFKKVTWPTKDQTIKQTGVVVVISLLTSVFLGLVDMGLSQMIQNVIG